VALSKHPITPFLTSVGSINLGAHLRRKSFTILELNYAVRILSITQPPLLWRFAMFHPRLILNLMT
jgi:hypothetical protein